MKFFLETKQRLNIYILMRRLGYHFQRENEQKKEWIFTRPAKGFPRFHLFVKKEKEGLAFALHLDQKKPLYKNSVAHMGDYDSQLVKEEGERIKNYIKNELK